MKNLHHLLNGKDQQKKFKHLCAQLREVKNEPAYTEKIDGIPMVQSDCSDSQNEQEPNLQRVKQAIEQYKHSKAKQIANIHVKTKLSIESIVADLRDQIHREVRNTIQFQYKGSQLHVDSCLKDGGSTFHNSQDRKIQTPGFDIPSSKQKNNQTVTDPRQFTLGQRGQLSSNHHFRSYNDAGTSFISEFHVAVRQSSSRRIKSKIMNSGKCKNR